MKKTIKTIAFVCAVVIMATLQSCESCNRFKKSWNSDFNGGLNRSAVLLDYQGDTIKVWHGKFDIRDSGSDNQIFFDINEKRVWIQGGIFISEED